MKRPETFPEKGEQQSLAKGPVQGPGPRAGARARAGPGPHAGARAPYRGKGPVQGPEPHAGARALYKGKGPVQGQGPCGMGSRGLRRQQSACNLMSI